MYFSIPFSLYPYYFARGAKFGNVLNSETENRLKLKLVQTQRTASHRPAADLRPPAADRRPPTAAKGATSEVGR